MKIIGIFSVLLLAGEAWASVSPSHIVAVRSRSEQFVVTGALPVASPRFNFAPPNPNEKVKLEPSILAVSAERIKQSLLAALEAPDDWRGKINLVLVPEERADILIAAVLYADGWNYRVEVPGRVAGPKLIRALVRVTLMEMANRQPGQPATAIPLWLAEGLARHLEATARIPLIVQPDTRLVINTRLSDPLRAAREQFTVEKPLSFADLNVSEDAWLSPGEWELFRHCAHLFVNELLNLPEGKAGLRELVRQLPNFLNWQFAFLRAFENRFATPLDVEKWWSVNLVNFTTRDADARLPWNSALGRLDALLRTAVEHRAGGERLPERREVSLQELLQQTEFAQQRPALHRLTSQLLRLQMELPPDLMRLVNDYRVTLEKYLNRRATASDPKLPGRMAAPIVRETVEQLDLLDVVREDFRRYGHALRPAPTATLESDTRAQ
jgi:hypothetical protein